MKKFAALVAVVALVAFAAPAFAANPFMDVPMNHWAYDAVSQLASRGVVSGYPDGAFKGEWKATRYEMASVVARALAYVDMNKASKQDLELLKKLVVEFKDELDALGVKVDELDSRVALLEEGVGGWYFSGNFRFTAKWSDDANGFYGVDQDTNWTVDRFRWNIRKVVDDKVTFHARLEGGGGAALTVKRAYAEIKFPWDITVNIGRFPLDWEGDFYATDWPGYMMNDAYVTDYDPLVAAVSFYKPFSMGSFSMFINRTDAVSLSAFTDYGIDEGVAGVYGTLLAAEVQSWTEGEIYQDLNSEAYHYGARLGFDFNEMFHMAVNYVKYDFAEDAFLEDWQRPWARGRAGVKLPWQVNYTWSPWSPWIPTGSWAVYDSYNLGADYSTLWGDLIVKFTPGIALKGQYFMQDLDPAWAWLDGDYPDYGEYDDSPNAWKVVLQVSQDVLKFTDLWIEYAQLDKGFVMQNDPYGWASGSGAGYLDGFNRVIADTTVMNLVARQKWNDQWYTYARYADFDVDAANADFYNWTVSVLYHYTPNIFFELGYDKLGGDGAPSGDNMIWFRTAVFF